MADTIKCGRITYDLEDGDTIMDNGACYQLITRKIHKGFNSYNVKVSKQAFKAFKNNKNVRINNNHNYSTSITLYTFIKEA